MPSIEYEQNFRAVADALGGLWDAVRDRHSEIPDVVAVLGDTEQRRGEARAWGHHVYTLQAGADTVAELVIHPVDVAESSPLTVLEFLLHEGTHGLAEARGIKDRSNRGRYHNKAFVKLAVEVGLICPPKPDSTYGFEPHGVADGIIEAYSEPLMVLTEARARPWMWTPATPDLHARKRTNWIPAVCACTPPRRIRCADSLLDEAAPVCPVCHKPYRPVPPEKP